MKYSEFLKMKVSSQDPRILRRTWEGQMTRDKLAEVLREKKLLKNNRLDLDFLTLAIKKEWELRKEKLDLEILSVSRALESWSDLTLYDLKFLSSLSCSDLSKIRIYNVHWMRQISSKHTMWEIFEYHYYPKYTFLYEIFKDSSLIDEKVKTELKEKARLEVWEMICDEVKNGTSIYSLKPSVLEHIFEYFSKKEVSDKLSQTWKKWLEKYVDSLWDYTIWLSEVDKDYNFSDRLKTQKDIVNHDEDLIETPKKQLTKNDMEEEKRREMEIIFDNIRLPVIQ